MAATWADPTTTWSDSAWSWTGEEVVVAPPITSYFPFVYVDVQGFRTTGPTDPLERVPL
jgi:hypothetical protein